MARGIERHGLLDDDDFDDDDFDTVPQHSPRQSVATDPMPCLTTVLPMILAAVPLLLLLAFSSGGFLGLGGQSAPLIQTPPPPPPTPSHLIANMKLRKEQVSPADRQTRRFEMMRRRRQRRKARAGIAASPPPPRSLVHTHIIPQGGSLAVECAGGTKVTRVVAASFGTPIVSANGTFEADPQCHSKRSVRVLEDACVGQSHCCLPIGTDNFRDDPCRGKVKTLAVTLEGCEEWPEPTRYKRHCSLLGQPLLCDEDIEFLATLELPPAPTPLKPAVAIMVDTSWRPHLQHYVVHNVRNHTGWHIQIFHGPSNGPKLKELFSSLDAEGAITLTDLGSDYMEDWQRLSSSKPLRAPYHSPSRPLALCHALSLLIRSRAPSPWRQ